jgi:hypothetical protein
MDLAGTATRSLRGKLHRVGIPFLAALCACLFIAQTHWLPPPFTLVMEVRSDRPLRLHLQYDRDYAGVRQEGSVTQIVPSHGESTTVRFP